MDPKQIQIIIEWNQPSLIKNVQCFLGFANFYRMFIKYDSKIAAPLTRLTRKEKFVWDEKVEEAFKNLKDLFTFAPVLVHPDPSKPFFALEAILSQYGEDNKLHLLAFRSQKNRL